MGIPVRVHWSSRRVVCSQDDLACNAINAIAADKCVGLVFGAVLEMKLERFGIAWTVHCDQLLAHLEHAIRYQIAERSPQRPSMYHNLRYSGADVSNVSAAVRTGALRGNVNDDK